MLEPLQRYIGTLADAPAPAEWPYVVRSPGRINLIGEHIDYTGGLVMPAAINHHIHFVVRPVEAPEWQLHAVDIEETFTLPLPITGRTEHLWVDYLAGIGVQFQDQGHFLPGLEIVFGGDLPRGSGMSSSAALEGGMAYLLNELLSVGLTRPELANLCRRSSNTFLGIPSGIMDQYASLNGRAEGPIVLNCHTLESEPVKNKLRGYGLMLVNCMVSHDLSDGAYGKRVAECNRALTAIQVKFPEVSYLSAATESQLDAVVATLDPTVTKRARYVIRENDRVRRAITALEAGASSEMGALLNETHRGLRDEYEVSCAELDFLQQTATEVDGVAGARMMGGGFGGCTINLLRLDRFAAFREQLTQRYQQQYGLTPEFYPVEIAAGTEMI
ncbi:galactokinase [Lewinella aquimaris]|uniref:Galactokinase n=1 Tax=Neolewinella aquimaris TaxID=1835722 RepID=A0A840E291_9BACT|nr:galactokinase [Neolewinella aquimaris]MBB4078073.1 galactokinase [Neolewinella aquimaris]